MSLEGLVLRKYRIFFETLYDCFRLEINFDLYLQSRKLNFLNLSKLLK